MASDNETHQDYQRALGQRTPRAKHTQEPWTVDEALAKGDRVISGAGGEVVALVLRCRDVEEDDPNLDDPERDTNARMIARAPELAAVLRTLLDEREQMAADDPMFYWFDKIAEKARTLLAAIEGE